MSKRLPTTKFRSVADRFYRDALSSLDYSEQALIDAYRKETYGEQCDERNNGWIFGKKAFDITVAAWREDLETGLTCKAEYLQDYEEDSIEYKFIENVLAGVIPAPFFGWTS